jgi:hypothetical protein
MLVALAREHSVIRQLQKYGLSDPYLGLLEGHAGRCHGTREAGYDQPRTVLALIGLRTAALPWGVYYFGQRDSIRTFVVA